ncbi:hypothetical protein SMIDD28_00860 [Streptococcus mitis]|uniref:Uncharacterized protein n=1 Tax=Streptococcus mitis TaxID=28037 RepID=A0A139Q964_STRMT|nr:hypothetical protein SMIDD28_00860 [Streptococcus mitis]
MLLNIATTTSQRSFNTPDTRSMMPLKTLTTISFNPPNMFEKPSLIFSPSPVESPVSTSNTPLIISAIPPITSEIVLKRTRQTSPIYSITGASTTVNFSTIKEMTGPKFSFTAFEKSAKLPIMPPIFSKAGSIWFLIVSAKPLPIFSRTGWIFSFHPLTKEPTTSDIKEELDSNKGLICSSYT